MTEDPELAERRRRLLRGRRNGGVFGVVALAVSTLVVAIVWRPTADGPVIDPIGSFLIAGLVHALVLLPFGLIAHALGRHATAQGIWVVAAACLLVFDLVCGVLISRFSG